MRLIKRFFSFFLHDLPKENNFGSVPSYVQKEKKAADSNLRFEKWPMRSIAEHTSSEAFSSILKVSLKKPRRF